MTINIHLDQSLLDLKMTLTKPAERIGITSANPRSSRPARPGLFDPTLEAICREPDCQPGEVSGFTRE